MGRPPLSPAPILLALLASTAVGAFEPAYAEASRFKSSLPPGFEDLQKQRRLVVDVYFRDRNLGQVSILTNGATLRFDDVDALVAIIPGLSDPSGVRYALSGNLSANAQAVCNSFSSGSCGAIAPKVAGVVLDEDRFRLDIYLAPDQLAAAANTQPTYLAIPKGGPTFLTRYSGTVSGSSSGSASYFLNSRSFLSLGSARLRSDILASSFNGIQADNLSAEMERGSLRFTGGLFWTPSGEIVGRRQILGVGVSSQIDTRSDRNALIGTPLPVFLERAARVEIWIDGSLVQSSTLPAGTTLIDPSSLPEGTYEAEIRIFDRSGSQPRIERRVFSKGYEAAPLGKPMFAAFAGAARDASGNREGFYQFSAAVRASKSVGFDARIFGTEQKAVAELGAIFFTPIVKVKGVALVSSAGDVGGALRATSISSGPISYSIDARTIRTKGGEPLLPTSGNSTSLQDTPDHRSFDGGSFTQFSGVLSARVRSAIVRATAYYRDTPDSRATYALGGSFEMPIIQSHDWNVTMEADGTRSDRQFVSFVGIRALFIRPNMSAGLRGGIRKEGSGGPIAVGEAQASFSRRTTDQLILTGNAAIGRDGDAAYARGNLEAQTKAVALRADALQRFGSNSNTQYSVGISGSILTSDGVVSASGGDQADAALIVAVAGLAKDQVLEVLVDDSPRGVVTRDHGLTIALPPYQAYRVRLRAKKGGSADFDLSEKEVALFPGRVERLNWTSKPKYTVFGRLIGPAGAPVANASLTGAHGIGQSQGGGYFQIEVSQGDTVAVQLSEGKVCEIVADWSAPADGLLDAGDIRCVQ